MPGECQRRPRAQAMLRTTVLYLASLSTYDIDIHPCRLTSGATYSGVPQPLLEPLLRSSSFEKPKSHSFTTTAASCKQAAS